MNDLYEILTQQQEIEQATSQQVHDDLVDRADDDQDTNIDPLGPGKRIRAKAPRMLSVTPRRRGPRKRERQRLLRKKA